jgi:hypothetical protein
MSVTQLTQYVEDSLVNSVDATQVAYTPAGDGAVVTTVQAKLRESVSVKDYGAVGDGFANDTAKIQAAITANPGKVIVFPKGTYSVTEIIVSGNNTILDLDGSSLAVRANNINCITFKPITAGATSDFLNGCSLRNGNILMTSYPTSTGAGVELRQCNGFTMENVVFYDADLQVYGGQLNIATGCRHYASRGSYKGNGSAMIHLQEAAYGSGLYQPCYTFEFSNWVVACGVLRDACIRVHSGDGITFNGGYAARGANTQVLVMSSRNGSYVGPLQFNGSYLDAVNPSTGSPNSVEIRADGNSSSFVYSLILNGCTLGNGTSVGVLCNKPETYVVSVIGCYIVNFASWAVSVEAGTTGDVLVSGCQLQNNGDGSSGVIRLAGTGGKSFNIAGNIFTNSQNVCVAMNGTWGRSAIVGNVNNSAISDIATSSAVFTSPLVLSGNASAYASLGNAFSWVGEKMQLVGYADNAAAVAAGLRTGQLYRTGGAVQVVT